MSLRGKDFRGEIDADLYEKLRQMAEFQKLDTNALGAQLLEKMIAAEWHAFSVLLERLERSGIVRRVGGTLRKIADSE